MTSTAIAYVVPTKDRPDDLAKLLVSLSRQSVLPTQIVIVDGSSEPIDYLLKDHAGLPLTYVREFPPSLARQRNAGMAALHDGVEVAGYLDDDLELEADATEKMTLFWDSALSSVGGASFTIINQPVRHRVLGFLSALFLINGKKQGKVLRSGFATSITTQPSNLRTEWLYGGATLWRRSVVRDYAYDEWYIGHGYLEDLDYSFRVSRKFELWVVSDAKVWHWPSPIKLSQNIKLGRQQVINRVYFVRKMNSFSRLAVGWGLCGQFVRNALESIWHMNRAGLMRCWGNILGLRDVILYGTQPADGIWK